MTASLVNPLYRHARLPENKNIPGTWCRGSPFSSHLLLALGQSASADANAFPSEPAQTLRKFGADFKSTPDHPLDAPSFALILLSQLDRIARFARSVR